MMFYCKFKANLQYNKTFYKILNKLFFSNNDPAAAGFGDVNISAILNSFQMGYDKRVRPNYGGK